MPKNNKPKLVDAAGNKVEVEEEKIGLNVLIDRCAASGMPDMWAMAATLNVDTAELQQAIYNLAKSQRFQPTKAQVMNIVGTIGWGIALGFAFAKKAAPIQTVH
jgi:hypothetical protein